MSGSVLIRRLLGEKTCWTTDNATGVIRQKKSRLRVLLSGLYIETVREGDGGLRRSQQIACHRPHLSSLSAWTGSLISPAPFTLHSFVHSISNWFYCPNLLSLYSLSPFKMSYNIRIYFWLIWYLLNRCICNIISYKSVRQVYLSQNRSKNLNVAIQYLITGRKWGLKERKKENEGYSPAVNKTPPF